MPRVPDAPQPQAGPDLDPTYLMMASGLAAEEAKARLFAMAIKPQEGTTPETSLRGIGGGGFGGPPVNPKAGPNMAVKVRT